MHPALCLPSKCSFSEFMEDDCLGFSLRCGLVGSAGAVERHRFWWSVTRPQGWLQWTTSTLLFGRVILRARCLHCRDQSAQLPIVYPFAVAMYQNELFNFQKQNAMVSQRRLGYRDVNSGVLAAGECCWRKGEWESSVAQLGPVSGLIGSPVPIPHHLPL